MASGAIAIAVVTLLLRPIPASADDSPNLEKMSCLYFVVEDFSAEEQSLGMNRDDLHNTLLIGVKVKMPRLTVRPNCRDWLYANVHVVKDTLQGGRAVGFSAAVTLQVVRPALLEATQERQMLRVWHDGRLLGGPLSDLRSMVNGAVDRVLNAFAADYYKAGNP